MTRKVLVIGSLVASLGVSCSKRDQYNPPGDQSKKVEIEKYDQSIPDLPTKPGAGLVGGRYVEPDQATIDAKNEKIAREEIVLNSRADASRGIAGISFGMTKKEIIEKLGQPTAEGYFNYLGGTQYLLIYVPAKAIVVMGGSQDTDKPSVINTQSGYLGKIKLFDGSTLGVGDEIKIDIAEFTQKQFNFVVGNKLEDDCGSLCTASNNANNKNYIVSWNNVGTLVIDYSSGVNRLSAVYLFSRSVNSNPIGNADIANATINGISLGTTWKNVNKNLSPEFIVDDFGLGVRSTGISLAGGAYLAFHAEAETKSAIPADNAKLMYFSINDNLSAGITLNNKMICFTGALEFSAAENCSEGQFSLSPTVLKGAPREFLKEFTESFKVFLKTEMPNSTFSVLSGLFDKEEYDEYGFSIYTLDANLKGTVVNISVGPFNNASVSMNASAVDGDRFSLGEMSNVQDTEAGKIVDLAKPSVAAKGELPRSVAGVSLDAIVVLNKTNEEKQFATVSMYPIESYQVVNVNPETGVGTVVNTNYVKEPTVKDAFTTYAENLVLTTSSKKGSESTLNTTNVTRVNINGVATYLKHLNDNQYKVFAIRGLYDVENLNLSVSCLSEERADFGTHSNVILDRVVKSGCDYLLPKDFDLIENLESIYLPEYKANLIFSDSRLAGFIINK